MATPNNSESGGGGAAANGLTPEISADIALAEGLVNQGLPLPPDLAGRLQDYMKNGVQVSPQVSGAILSTSPTTATMTPGSSAAPTTQQPGDPNYQTPPPAQEAQPPAQTAPDQERKEAIDAKVDAAKELAYVRTGMVADVEAAGYKARETATIQTTEQVERSTESLSAKISENPFSKSAFAKLVDPANFPNLSEVVDYGTGIAAATGNLPAPPAKASDPEYVARRQAEQAEKAANLPSTAA